MNVVVIGANYGDEGKGRTVDFLAKAFWGIEDKPSLNVRFSGSNNAAHTVWKNGKSFVFHIIGAASFYGMPTYLSQHVVVDFVALAKEIAEFEKIADLRSKAFDLNTNISIVESSIMLARAYGVEESKILKNENDLQSFLFD